MKSLLLAMQFLAVFPIKVKRFTEKDFARAVLFFPVIGGLLGLILAGANALLASTGFDSMAANMILVVLLVICTGGLHLDGLADTADAFLSGKPRDEMLVIMRDPHIGAMGAICVIAVLMLKVAFLSSINIGTKGPALILMCVLSRWSMALSVFAFPYARKEGKAKGFMDGADGRTFIAATIITILIVTVIARSAGMVLLAVTAVWTYASDLFIKKRIGGLTGDTIGAVNESSELVCLFAIAVTERMVI